MLAGHRTGSRSRCRWGSHAAIPARTSQCYPPTAVTCTDDRRSTGTASSVAGRPTGRPSPSPARTHSDRPGGRRRRREENSSADRGSGQPQRPSPRVGTRRAQHRRDVGPGIVRMTASGKAVTFLTRKGRLFPGLVARRQDDRVRTIKRQWTHLHRRCTGRKRPTTHLRPASTYDPAWSPDGSKILFTRSTVDPAHPEEGLVRAVRDGRRRRTADKASVQPHRLDRPICRLGHVGLYPVEVVGKPSFAAEAPILPWRSLCGVNPAGATGLEPATPGFGDRCSTN